jgi:pyruvate kinase
MYQEAAKLRPHKTCAMMVEIRGREIRTTAVDERVLATGATGIHLKANASVYINCENPTLPSDAAVIHVSYKELPRLVKPNDLIYLDDGKIILLVNECERDGLRCEVKGGGILGSYRNIKLPAGKHEHMPILTQRDQDDIMTLITKQKCDYIAIPYAVRKRDITTVRDTIGYSGAHLQLLAKIDTIESIHNFEELIKSADGVIINRVELSLEMHAEKLVLA